MITVLDDEPATATASLPSSWSSCSATSPTATVITEAVGGAGFDGSVSIDEGVDHD